ncbi:hypothetical protein [Geodermatophilus obscurus]|uniref:hypothetical protein n=1 Tax=Geodermatophilus obscurus TaxID=1861 RepID=UPI000943D87B|nr:hypothetical protein [Geodermatophilus obscurus]
MRLAVGALVTSYVAVAMLGALYTPLVTLLLLAPVLGALGAAVGRSVHRTVYRDFPETWTGAWPTAVAAALFVPFAAGVHALGEAGGHLVMVLVLLFSVLSTVWAHGLEIPHAPSRTTTEPPRPATQQPEWPDGSSSHELLRALSVDDLIAEWRSSGEQLHPSSGAPRHTAVRWREALLEELRRRDPQGFDNWVLDGMRRGPEHHIAADPDDAPGDGPDVLPAR